MNLVKWFRKNNTKIMAVMVILLMIAFIGGSSLSYLLQPGMKNETVAYYGDNLKIKNQDIITARNELDLLKMLKANILLRILPATQFFQDIPDLHAFLLGELLFSEQRISPEAVNALKRIIRTNKYQIAYQISDKQIYDMYDQTVPSTIYWICLKSETQQAGIQIRNEDAGQLLGMAIPQLFNGGTYSQVIGSIARQSGISEEQILSTFSKLLSILQYAHWACSGEDITIRQLMETMAQEKETIDAEFVEFKSSVFAENQEDPGEEEIIEHFEKYKKYFPGEISEENPYAFGYKLPNMVQLEYIALRPDDVELIVEPPSQDELEEFYENNKKQLFTENTLEDPNDPNSPLKVTPYSEVASDISKQLLQTKIQSQTNSIIKEAISLTESSFEDMNETEINNLSTEQFKEKAGDYKTVAENLSQKHNITIFSGQTGLIGPLEMQNDEYLAPLYVQYPGYNAVALTQVVFAVKELAACELGPSEGQAPRMYQNIGPVRDQTGKIMALVRVIQTVKAYEPNTVDQAFNTSSFIFDPNQQDSDDNIFSVRKNVVEDLKKLTALETTKNTAEEFVKAAETDGWQETVEKYNDIYGQNDANKPNDPNSSETTIAEELDKPFRLENIPGLNRLSKAILETLSIQTQSNPASSFFDNEREKSARFVELLFSLAPQDSNGVEALPTVVEFKPDISYYAVKNISLKQLWKEVYEKNKAVELYRDDLIKSQSLAIVHFKPANVLKRMNFKSIETEEKTTESETPEEPEVES